MGLLKWKAERLCTRKEQNEAFPKTFYSLLIILMFVIGTFATDKKLNGDSVMPNDICT